MLIIINKNNYNNYNNSNNCNYSNNNYFIILKRLVGARSYNDIRSLQYVQYSQRFIYAIRKDLVVDLTQR